MNNILAGLEKYGLNVEDVSLFEEEQLKKGNHH